MQLKKVFKGILIAVPVVTMMACSSTPEGPSEEQLKQQAEMQAQKDMEAKRAAEAQALTQAREQEEMRKREMRNQMESLVQDSVVYFDFDTSNLSSSASSTLRAHANFLASNPGQSIVIEGHCDRRGTPEYNIALGERRAKSVETYLLNAGVSSSQISIVSYGEEKPVATGTTESAFAQNRRGVLVYQ
ncbi:peptidoglycan-associated lipoprotein Pal [Aliiglaciecola litoralis]